MLKAINPASLLFDDTRKIVVFKENRSKYTANNVQQKNVEGYQVDGVLIVKGQRCDKCLALPTENKLFLVELKGSDLPHACEQIESTIRFLNSHGFNRAIEARIVLTKVSGPDLETIQYKSLSRKIRKGGGTLKKECLELEETV
jgi:hypothetical protein